VNYAKILVPHNKKMKIEINMILIINIDKLNFLILEVLLIKPNMGIGDWGLGIGDWGLGPIPNPQSPIPNPQSPMNK